MGELRKRLKKNIEDDFCLLFDTVVSRLFLRDFFPISTYLNCCLQVRHLFIGFVGGIMFVVCIQSLNSLLGFVNFSFSSNLGSSSLNFSGKIKAYGQMFLLAGQGLLMAAGVAFVEELLFRSWLLEEIAADLGYHPGIFLSGLAFALSQRYICIV